MFIAGLDSCSVYLVIYRDVEKYTTIYLAVLLQKGKWDSKFSLLMHHPVRKCLVHQPPSKQFVSERFPVQGPELPYPLCMYGSTNAISSAFEGRNADFLGLVG